MPGDKSVSVMVRSAGQACAPSQNRPGPQPTSSTRAPGGGVTMPGTLAWLPAGPYLAWIVIRAASLALSRYWSSISAFDGMNSFLERRENKSLAVSPN